MIKFSVSHSSILQNAGELEHEVAHAMHLNTIKALLESAGAVDVHVTRVNVMARIEDSKFFQLFEVAEKDLSGSRPSN